MLTRLANVIYWGCIAAAAIWLVVILGAAGVLTSGPVSDRDVVNVPAAVAKKGPWTLYAPAPRPVTDPAILAQLNSRLPPGFVLDPNPLRPNRAPEHSIQVMIIAAGGAFLIWLAGWAARYILRG